MAFWRDDGFVQPSLTPDREPPLTRDSSSYALMALHNASGNWVTLTSFATEELATQAVRDCYMQQQPDRDRVAVKFDHFSAYKWESRVTVCWRT